MKKSKIIRIVALIAALVIIISAVFIIKGCSAPPKYEEIEERFIQLMTDSQEVNSLLFGEGLATYERVYHPKDNTKVYSTGEYYEDDGEQKERKVWYYKTLDEKYEIYAFRSSYLAKYAYAFVSEKEMNEAELALLFPSLDGAVLPEGSSFYTELYRSADGKNISYLVPYAEKEYEFYYTSLDEKLYDYVRADAEYHTIDQIKELAQTVYSNNYLTSLYGALFDGIVSDETMLNPKFKEIGDTMRLAQLNTYKPLFTEQRVYLFDSAKIIGWGSKKDFVRIEIQSYLPSSSDNVITSEIQMVLQNGQWFLDCPTY